MYASDADKTASVSTMSQKMGYTYKPIDVITKTVFVDPTTMLTTVSPSEHAHAPLPGFEPPQDHKNEVNGIIVAAFLGATALAVLLLWAM